MLRNSKLLASRALFALVVAAAWGLVSSARPAADPELNWYKGNLHTHTINSDGDSAPDAVARWYKEQRYHFLALTDHNYFTDPQGLQSFFGADERFLLITGEEVTSGYEESPVHVNAFGLSSVIEPSVGGSVVDTVQQNVDAIRAASALPSLNHPNFHWAVSPAELSQVRNLKLFEVFNGHPTTNDAGAGNGPSLDAMWDTVLSAGSRMFGIAVDDAHSFKEFSPTLSNPGRGWVQVRARKLSQQAVLSALENGDFYATNGVELSDVVRLEDGLRIDVKPSGDAKYSIRFLGVDGKLLKESAESPAEYHLGAGEPYVRAKVLDSNGHSAWVQPVFAR